MAVSVLLFSSRGLAFDVCPLLRFSEPGRRLSVPHSLHTDRAEFSIVIDGAAVLIDRLAVNRYLATNGIPLAAARILQDLIVPTGRCIASRIVECGTGTISITHFKMAVLTVSTVNSGNLTIIAGHEVLEYRLVVCISKITGLKMRRLCLLLHGIPLNAVGCLHNSMGCIGFLEEGAVVPKGVSAAGIGCFDHAVINSPEHRTILGTGECCRNQGCFCIPAVETVSAAVVMICTHIKMVIAIIMVVCTCGIAAGGLVCPEISTGDSMSIRLISAECKDASICVFGAGIGRMNHASFGIGGRVTGALCGCVTTRNASECFTFMNGVICGDRAADIPTGFCSFVMILTAILEGRELRATKIASFRDPTGFGSRDECRTKLRLSSVMRLEAIFGGTSVSDHGLNLTNRSASFMDVAIIGTTARSCITIGCVTVRYKGLSFCMYTVSRSRDMMSCIATFMALTELISRNDCCANAGRSISAFSRKNMGRTRSASFMYDIVISTGNDCSPSLNCRTHGRGIPTLRRNTVGQRVRFHFAGNTSMMAPCKTDTGNKSCTSLIHFSLRRHMFTRNLMRVAECRSIIYLSVMDLIMCRIRNTTSADLRCGFGRIRKIRSLGSQTGTGYCIGMCASKRNDLGVRICRSGLYISSAFRDGTGRTRLILNSSKGVGRISCTADQSANFRNSRGMTCKRRIMIRGLSLRLSGRISQYRCICIIAIPRLTSRYRMNLISNKAGRRVTGCSGHRIRHFRNVCCTMEMAVAIFMTNITGESTRSLRHAGSAMHQSIRARSVCPIVMKSSPIAAGYLSTRNMAGLVGINSASTLVTCHTAEGGRIIEGTSALSAGHLIPLAAVRCSNHTVRYRRFLILGCAVHINLGLFATGRCGSGADMTTCDLCPLHLEALHVGHVVAQGTICNIAGNGTGCTRRAGCHRSNGLTIQCGAISGSDAAESTGNKSGTAAEAHSRTTFDYCVSDIRIGIEAGGKACRKSSGSCACSGCSCSTAAPAKDTAGRSGTASHTGYDPGCHQQLHAHTGSGLGHVEAHGRKVAVKPLRAFQICQGAKKPQEKTSLSCCQRTAASDKLSYGGCETSQEPDIHHQKQELGSYHAAPGLKDIVGALGCAHRERQGRSVAQNTHDDIPLHCFQQELEIVPAQGYEKNQDQDEAHNTGRCKQRGQTVGQDLFHAGKGEILTGHGNIHQ